MKYGVLMREENWNTRRKKLLEKQRDWEVTHSTHMPRRVWEPTQNALVEDAKVSSSSPLDKSMKWAQYEKKTKILLSTFLRSDPRRWDTTERKVLMLVCDLSKLVYTQDKCYVYSLSL